jgi:hypothetical protein
MTWRRIAFYYLLLAAAVAAYLGTAPTGSVPEADGGKVPLLELRADQVVELQLVRGNAWVRCGQEAGRWRVLEPPGASAPPDLVATFAVTLVEMTATEVVTGETEGQAQFGLEGEGATRVDLYRVGHEEPLTVILGARNPPETAVYAKVEGRPGVFLVGRVLQYYADGILEAAMPRPSPGPSASAPAAERATAVGWGRPCSPVARRSAPPPAAERASRFGENASSVPIARVEKRDAAPPLRPRAGRDPHRSAVAHDMLLNNATDHTAGNT